MSGQPNRYAADAAKFRQDYMNALDLRSALDDQVLQAVKVYKQTGQVPAISSIPDNRTAEEKLKDIEGLKASIIAEMKPIGSSQFAQEVIQRIMRSPLNSDGSFFTFFAQRVSGIVKNLKDSYSIGIKGDSNDVERLVSSVEDLYSKDKAMATTTKSYFDRPSNTGVGSISAGDLTALRNQYEQIIPKILARAHKSRDANIEARARAVRDKFEAISTFMNTDRYKLITARIQQVTGIAGNQVQIPGNQNPGIGARQEDIDRLYDIYNSYNDLINVLPSSTKLSAMLIQLEKSISNADNDLSQSILTQIDSLLPPPQKSADIQVAINRYAHDYGFHPHGGLRPFGRRMTRREEALLGPRPVEPVLNTGAPGGAAPPMGGTVNDIEQWARNIAALEPPGGRTASAILFGVQGMSLVPNALAAYGRLRIGGEGIHPEKRRRGRPKGCGIKVPFSEKVDKSQGVQASPRYISFGKHVINKKKLGDGILSIRTKSGANIAASPVRHISQNMKIVVDKIIGGAIPSYEELSKLTEEEKAYLHKVSKQADILDKFSIPAPSKDQEEKEIHEYEVMRGEIMSGNDNKELIKKFKFLIIKLSRRGALPKKEVTDILSELIELGY